MAKKNTTEELENTAGANTAPAVSTDTPATDSPNTPLDNPDATADISAPALFTLDTLADKHRVASWQQAALVRLTGWAEGKQVTEAEYTTALNNLQYRRMGSGRA